METPNHFGPMSNQNGMTILVTGLKKGGTLYQESKEKANILNDQFMSVFTDEETNEKMHEMDSKKS